MRLYPGRPVAVFIVWMDIAREDSALRNAGSLHCWGRVWLQDVTLCGWVLIET